MLYVEKGDISKIFVDAIVNAANRNLMSGGGVDGDIHKAAGSQLLEACKEIAPCETGEAKITPGFKLPAKYVIHTVGPIWQGGNKGEDVFLAACYRNSLLLAIQHKLKSVALPNISTGIYGFPKDRAARIALENVREVLRDHPTLNVYFVCYDDENYELYRSLTRSAR